MKKKTHLTGLLQVVLLCILAQLGSYVPAEAATFRVPDRIFSRVSTRDSMETNSSTFMIEMQETSFILANVGPTSLVIIDELGRGTSVAEGAAICWAVAEHLLLHSTAFVFLATHFRQMTRLAELHPCATNHHFLTEAAGAEGEEGEGARYTHRLVVGRPADGGHRYGIELAAQVLPAALVARARQIVVRVESRAEVAVPPAAALDAACLRAFVELKRLGRLGVRGRELGEGVARVKRRLLEETAALQAGEVEEGGGGDEVEEEVEVCGGVVELEGDGGGVEEEGDGGGVEEEEVGGGVEEEEGGGSEGVERSPAHRPDISGEVEF